MRSGIPRPWGGRRRAFEATKNNCFFGNFPPLDRSTTRCAKAAHTRLFRVGLLSVAPTPHMLYDGIADLASRRGDTVTVRPDRATHFCNPSQVRPPVERAPMLPFRTPTWSAAALARDALRTRSPSFGIPFSAPRPCVWPAPCWIAQLRRQSGSDSASNHRTKERVSFLSSQGYRGVFGLLFPGSDGLFGVSRV